MWQHSNANVKQFVWQFKWWTAKRSITHLTLQYDLTVQHSAANVKHAAQTLFDSSNDGLSNKMSLIWHLPFDSWISNESLSNGMSLIWYFSSIWQFKWWPVKRCVTYFQLNQSQIVIKSQNVTEIARNPFLWLLPRGQSYEGRIL